MIELLTAWAIKNAVVLAGGSIAAFILGWILKKIPTGKWAKDLGKIGEKNGQSVTAFCNKKIPFWNKVIEPVFIDTISVLLSYVGGFIMGLKSDDQT
ncbi:MAG: hypothetical protein GWP06_00385 [Actinobacteria bacterium]|nr:hypothetical protein [Actinomycetota bacterium]